MDWFKNHYKKIIFLGLLPLVLAGLNYYIISGIFQGEFNNNISSIEVAFFTDAKFISSNFPNLSWNPEWYMGFPFGNVYPPLLPFGIAYLKSIFGAFSWAQLYRILMGVFYIIGPITLYFFVRYLTRRNMAALLAALGYSILPSFSYLIGNTASYGEMANMGSLRLVVLQVFGEGPHVAALALIPLAALLFLYSLRNSSLKSKILASLGITLVAMVNWIGFVALVLILLVVWLSEAIKGKAGQKTKDVFTIFLMAYGFMAFWFNLSFLKASIGFGGGGRGEGDLLSNYLKILPLLPILIPALVAISWALSKKIKKVVGLATGVLWLIVFLSITLSWYYWEIAYLPQPPRYMPEVNMGAFIVLGIILDGVYRKIIGPKPDKKKRKPLKVIVGSTFIVLVILSMFYFSRSFLTEKNDLLRPHEDITETYPYQIADFLKDKVDKDERVFATANVAFWLDYFTEIQQIKGAADPASIHPWWDHALYQILTGENAPRGKSLEMSHAWLKAINANYIVVNGPGSKDPFNDYKDPEKFEEWNELYKSNGDIIYEVPLENPSLAQVVDETGFDNIEEPAGGADFKRVNAYAEWVEDETKPKASFSWLNNQEFEIEAEVNQGELVSVQIAYDNGWRVTADGRRLKTEMDAIGNLVIFPREYGTLKIKGEHSKTLDVWLGYLITLGTISLVVWRLIIRNKNAKTSPKKERKITKAKG